VSATSEKKLLSFSKFEVSGLEEWHLQGLFTNVEAANAVALNQI
jgi:hypothetical protein